MRQFFLWAMVSMALIGFTACEPNTPQEPEKQDTIPASFPKKHLIEEFTGQGCGYCPDGMDAVHEFIGNDTNWVLVLHHYGYAPDNYTVAGSKTITNALGVDGAPSITINRAKTKYGKNSTTVFHPGYLPDAQKAQFETETYASIQLDNTYDPATRELIIKVKGAICTEEHPDLKLTVLVKESGMIGKQADYEGSFKGWKEFRHTNAVRAILSDPKGDDMLIVNQRYNDIYSILLDKKWVPENCMVVAFISEAFKPVIQVEQKPVVAGTQGGADIMHGGITPEPVSDFYPEPSATAAPADYSGSTADTLNVANAFYSVFNGVKIWQIQAYNMKQVVSVNKTVCAPFSIIYLYTEASATDIPAGSYPLNQTEQPGSVLAGFRDDTRQLIDGSMFFYTNLSYLINGYLEPAAQWLIADGEMNITDTGWELTGHARNGADIHLVGSTKIANKGRASSPKKQQKMTIL